MLCFVFPARYYKARVGVYDCAYAVVSPGEERPLAELGLAKRAGAADASRAPCRFTQCGQRAVRVSTKMNAITEIASGYDMHQQSEQTELPDVAFQFSNTSDLNFFVDTAEIS